MAAISKYSRVNVVSSGHAVSLSPGRHRSECKEMDFCSHLSLLIFHVGQQTCCWSVSTSASSHFSCLAVPNAFLVHLQTQNSAPPPSSYQFCSFLKPKCRLRKTRMKGPNPPTVLWTPAHVPLCSHYLKSSGLVWVTISAELRAVVSLQVLAGPCILFTNFSQWASFPMPLILLEWFFLTLLWVLVPL